MSSIRITGFDVHDVRFPTSDDGHGSDAMHPDPDYSAAVVVLQTDQEGLEGHGLAFTLGRGTELVCAAVRVLAPHLVGRTLLGVSGDLGGLWRALTSDSQLRWVGPEKGVVHLATAAVVNALWDLLAKEASKPLWRYVCDLAPEELVAAIDFRYLTDVLTPEEALGLLHENESSKEARVAELGERGFPAYTTSVGWLGYPDEKIRALCRRAVAQGWTHFKMKVGADLEDDVRRARLLRDEIGPDRFLMMDANQRWDVDEAIRWMEHLAPFGPLWIEEPTSPDDVLGHARIAEAVAPIGVATGEQCHNRVVFKQLLQTHAISYCQLDTCRLGGLNEVLAVLLLAKKFGVPVCPHAGGVGLCEMVAHVVAIDHARIGASLEGRVAEYVDHLHEHFEDPCEIRDAAYVLPDAPGYSTTLKRASLERFRFPDGPVWRLRAKDTR